MFEEELKGRDAVVVDSCVFDVFDHLQYSSRDVFTLQKMVDIFLGTVFPKLFMRRDDFQGFIERRGGDRLSDAQKLEVTLEYMALTTRKRFYDLDESELVRVLKATLFFLDCGGYVADPSDDAEPFQEGILGNRVKLREFLSYLPKPFIDGCRASYEGLPPQKRIDAIVDAYGLVLSRKGFIRGLNYIRPNVVSDMKFYVRKALRGGSFDTSGLEDDIDLVALACSLPYNRVVVFSDDSDVVALTYFARAFLGKQNLQPLRRANSHKPL